MDRLPNTFINRANHASMSNLIILNTEFLRNHPMANHPYVDADIYEIVVSIYGGIVIVL